MILWPTMRCSRWGIFFNFTTMFIQRSFQPSSCLANVTKITRKTWNKTDATSLHNRNRTFRRWKFDFVDRFKRDFVTKTWMELRDFERDRRVKRQNYRIKIWVTMANTLFRLLGFIRQKSCSPRQKARDFK